MAHIVPQWYQVNALLRVDSQTRAQITAHVFTRIILCHDMSRTQNANLLGNLGDSGQMRNYAVCPDHICASKTRSCLRYTR